MLRRDLSTPRRLITVCAVAATAGLFLTSCAQGNDAAAPAPTESSATSPAEAEPSEGTDEATTTDEPTADESGTPGEEDSSEDPDALPTSEAIDLSCDQLITNQQMYDYNANIALLENTSFDETTNVGSINELGGLTCQWQNASSEYTIDVGVARFEDETLTRLKNLAVERVTPVPTYRSGGAEEGYFSSEANDAQAFAGSYWISMRSEAFLEPGDAQPLIENVLSNLPS